MLFFREARSVKASSSGLSSTSRITCCSWTWMSSSIFREGKGKRSSLSHGSLGPGPTAVAMDNASHRGQANPGARELGRYMQPLKGSEQLANVGHVEAGAVIADEIDRRSVALRNADFDPRQHFVHRKFPGVAEQILEHDPQQA